jgi:hypothetical protein
MMSTSMFRFLVNFLVVQVWKLLLWADPANFSGVRSKEKERERSEL